MVKLTSGTVTRTYQHLCPSTLSRSKTFSMLSFRRCNLRGFPKSADAKGHHRSTRSLFQSQATSFAIIRRRRLNGTHFPSTLRAREHRSATSCAPIWYRDRDRGLSVQRVDIRQYTGAGVLNQVFQAVFLISSPASLSEILSALHSLRFFRFKWAISSIRCASSFSRPSLVGL